MSCKCWTFSFFPVHLQFFLFITQISGTLAAWDRSLFVQMICILDFFLFFYFKPYCGFDVYSETRPTFLMLRFSCNSQSYPKNNHLAVTIEKDMRFSLTIMLKQHQQKRSHILKQQQINKNVAPPSWIWVVLLQSSTASLFPKACKHASVLRVTGRRKKIQTFLHSSVTLFISSTLSDCVHYFLLKPLDADCYSSKWIVDSQRKR